MPTKYEHRACNNALVFACMYLCVYVCVLRKGEKLEEFYIKFTQCRHTLAYTGIHLCVFKPTYNDIHIHK